MASSAIKQDQIQKLEREREMFDSSDVKIFQTVVEHMEQGVLVYDGKKILGANAQLCEVLDCPKDIVAPGTDIARFIEFGVERGHYYRNAGLVLQTMRMKIAAAEDYVVERLLPTGRTIRIDCRNPGGIGIATYTDVSDAKKQTAVLEATFDAMAQGILVHDREKIIATNRRLGDLLSIPQELTKAGSSWEALVQYRIDRGDYDSKEEYLKNVYAAFDKRESFSSETQAASKTLLTECRFEHSMMFVTYTDITEARAREMLLKEKESQVRLLAETDGLTELTNRRAFDNDLTNRIERRRETGDEGFLALLLIDLDRFKPINDTYGHGPGDALLQELANRFKSVVRKEDTVARIGGDEFAAIIETNEMHDVYQFANRLREAAKSVVVVGDIELRVDASVGIAFHSEMAPEPDDLLTAADLALYEAKALGRGTVQVYEPTLSVRAKERYSLEQDLRSALANDEIILHYQVQRELSSNVNVGYEALMRWEHPQRGLVSPAEFIPLAEETGLIVDLGRWALMRATHDFAGYDETTRIAVNVSPVQFVKSDLVADVKHALETSGLAANRLEIEITEDLLIEDTENTLRILNELRDLGLSLSLDDFGSGYSSLAYLTRFPFTKLKIDRCFIERMLQDDQSRTLVKSILALASSLNMKVTAEGVETKEQLAMLSDSSCDEAQGYLLGRPSPFKAC